MNAAAQNGICFFPCRSIFDTGFKLCLHIRIPGTYGTGSGYLPGRIVVLSVDEFSTKPVTKAEIPICRLCHRKTAWHVRLQQLPACAPHLLRLLLQAQTSVTPLPIQSAAHRAAASARLSA